VRHAAASREQVLRAERRTALRFGVLLAVMAAVVILSAFAACLFGRIDIPPAAVGKALLSGFGWDGAQAVDETRRLVVFDIRFSRVLLSMLVGLSLAVAGAVFQGILRNPLADPFTIGVSTGAAFGASLAIFLGLGARSVLGFGLLPAAALAGAMAALFFVIALGRIEGHLRRDTMILAGIVVATFLSALISLLKSLDEESVASIVFWVMGSFQGRGWTHTLFALPYAAAGLALVGFHARELDILAMGDLQAVQVGVNLERVRLVLLLGASLLTAAAVSVSGVIGFVGLIVPHLVRMTVGAEHRRLLALSGLLGAVTLLWSDVLARTLLPGGEELPVGVVTALMGGPFFCILLKRHKRRIGL
jgi:iron complex transport system permease protein